MLAALVLAALAFSLMQTMVVPALPTIQEEYGASSSATTWLLTGFLLSASVSTPLIGKLGDVYGKGRMLTLVLVLFAIGCVVAALSTTIEMLIAARLFSGVAGGVFPLAFGIIRDTFPRERVALGIGLISAVFGIGGGIGMPLSGVIVDHTHVSVIFWTGLVALPAALAAWRFVPPSPTRERTGIDWAGAAVLSAGLASLLIGVSKANDWGWGSTRVLGLLTIGVVVLAGWLRLEGRVREPLIELSVLRRRAVLLTNVAAFVVGIAMFSSFLLIPQLVQIPESAGYGFGATVTQAGLFLLPSAVVMLFAGPTAGRLGGRFGSRLVLVAGGLFCTFSFGWLALEHSEAWQVLIASAFMGAGISFAFASMANLIVEAVPAHEVGIATGINTISRTIGGAFGSQVAVTILTAHLVAGGMPAESGFTNAFLMAAGGSLVAAAIAAGLPRTRPVTAPAPAAA